MTTGNQQPHSTAGPLALRGRLVLPDGLVDDGLLVLRGDRIDQVGPAGDVTAPPDATEARLPPDATLIPGLVDLHCHGAGGDEFGPDRAASRRAADYHHRHGTTSVVASLVSAPADTLVEGARTCGALAAEGVVAGVHLEGPFLSPLRRGAQDPASLLEVDLALLDHLLEALRGHGTAMTIAPELTGARAAADRLAAAGMLPALGHTDADARTMTEALESAVTALRPVGRLPLVTHLFNGMPAMHHRRPGAAGAALAAAARGVAVVEVIGDGAHVADEMLATVLHAAAPDCAVLVSDATPATGMPDGRHRLGRLDVVVEGGVAVLADGTSMAGSVTTLLDAVRRAVHSGVDLVRAVRAASSAPARALGIDGQVGALAPGLRADVVAVDGSLRRLAVWRQGGRCDTEERRP